MIKNIVIAGAGFGGWYTALSLLNNLPDINVTLIGSSKIPKLSVGESLAFDAPYNLKRLLQLDNDRMFMFSTGAIYKYAIEYQNINADNASSFHGRTHNLKIGSLAKFYSGFDYPDYHEPYNIQPGDHGIVDTWLWDYQANKKDINDYANDIGDAFFFGTGPYAPYDTRNNYILRHEEGHAYHMDAEKTADLLRDIAIKKHAGRITEIDAIISDVQLTEQGLVSGLLLDNHNIVSGDLYCDLTGFKRLLISKMPNTEWVNRSKYFPDSAMVAPTYYTNPKKEMVGATQFFGEEYGWRFKIKLFHRIGNGYLFKSELVNSDIIAQRMHECLGDDVNLNLLKWNPGYYNKPWGGNVIALGLAGGLIDAFDGNNVSTHSRALENMISVFSKGLTAVESQDLFNELQYPVLYELDVRLKLIFAFSTKSGKFWDLKREQCKEEALFDVLESIITRKTGSIDQRLTWNWQQQYARIIAMTGLDISKFNLKKPTDADLDMVRAFWKYNNARNQYIKTLAWPNYYEWIKHNRFNDIASDEFLRMHS